MASGFYDLTNEGGVVAELEQDMLTIRTGPDLLFPVKGKPGAFRNHAFLEASSIRKIDGRYCFVYSSEHNHELCCAWSDFPKGPFVYGGTLIDLGDLYLDGNEDELYAVNYLGNTHGGLCEIGGQWYVFYHRQTNRNSYARQACAEPLSRTPDGGFRQAELASCGLNGGPLEGLGQYEARIACNLWSGEGTYRYDAADRKKVLKTHPYFTQHGKDREKDGDQYIANMRDGAVAGFKYFRLGEAKEILVKGKGKARGRLQLFTDAALDEKAAEICIGLNGNEGAFSSAFCAGEGTKPLYFRYEGDGSIDFIAFSLS